MTGRAAAPVLGVRDVAASVQWYVEVLGFGCGPGDVFAPPGQSAVYATLSLGSALLHLQIRRRDVWARPREVIEGDAYVFVEDADDLFARHAASGATMHREIEDSPYGLRDYTVETPDGHRITFGSAVAT